MTFLRLILVVTFWVALAAGLFLTGHIALGGEKEPPMVAEARTLKLDEKSELAVQAKGELELAVALAVRTDRDAKRVYQRWSVVDQNRAGSVGIDITRTDEETFSWSLPLAQMTVGDETIFRETTSYLILARRSYESPGPGEAELSFAAQGDVPMSERDRLTLIVGNLDEDFEVVVRKPKTPGLVLFYGLAGVFGHLFLVFGRLLVPFREHALPAEDF